MKINLVIEDEKGKNVLFITSSGLALNANEALIATSNKVIGNSHIVLSTNTPNFIRSNPNKTNEDNLDSAALSLSQLEEGLINYDSVKDLPALREYEKIRQANILRAIDCIFVDGTPRKRKSEVIAHIKKYKSEITEAATKQNIDPKLFTAILIDEYLRMGPNDWFDWSAKIGKNTSIGIAQVQVENARNVIKLGYYNPNPNDPKLSKNEIRKTSKAHLYQYLTDPTHSINFSAAVIRTCKESWRTNKPEELASLSSKWTKKSKKKVDITARGIQIATEFHDIAEELF